MRARHNNPAKQRAAELTDGLIMKRDGSANRAQSQKTHTNSRTNLGSQLLKRFLLPRIDHALVDGHLKSERMNEAPE